VELLLEEDEAVEELELELELDIDIDSDIEEVVAPKI
jgi:hypothetical protein